MVKGRRRKKHWFSSLYKMRRRMRAFKALVAKYALPHWPLYILLVILNLALVGIGMANTALTAAVIDTLDHRDHPVMSQSTGENIGSYSLNNIGEAMFALVDYKHLSLFHIILALAGVGLVLAISRGVIQVSADLLSSYTTSVTSRRMRMDLFSHLISFPISFYHSNKTGSLVSRIDSDVQDSIEGLQQVINGFLVNPMMLTFYVIITIRTSWVLLSGIMLAGVAHYALTYLLSRPSKSNLRNSLNLVADLRGLLYEVFSNIRVVKSLSSEEWEKNRLLVVLKNMVKVSLFGQTLGSLNNAGRLFINSCVQIIILVFAAHELASGRIGLTSCMLFVFICQSMVKPISDMSMAFMVAQRMVTSSERVSGYMRVAPSLKDGPETPAPLQHHLTLDGVCFAYDKRVVLSSITLEIKRGEMIALVGPSGAGKSTLVDLLIRFYDPTQGRILLDGVDIRQFRQRDYRNMFGIVSQESLLFNATVRENIAYGRQGISEAQITRACDMAHVTEFLRTLPKGLDSQLGDRGVRLSGGQRQRLSIARALVGNPSILILDEATSALDSESEKMVKDAIDLVTQTTTSIVVAHRLSTIMHANRIVVMEQGQIVGVGPHHRLMEECTLYRKLCRLQFDTKES